ncbi:MAG: peroxiredoxin [Candidatus Parvarchaeota archaeon]|nr:peroxiredoxin [Candidatus Parvarchaeota archaeon]
MLYIKVSEGDKFPEFSLSDDSGNIVNNSSLTGNVNVVYFYPKDMTPGCTKEACDFKDNMEKFKTAGISVYGISTDSIESHKKFKDKHGLNFSLLSDKDKVLVDKLGIKSIVGSAKRVTFLVDKNGSIIKIYPNVTPDGHAEEILNFISGINK